MDLQLKPYNHLDGRPALYNFNLNLYNFNLNLTLHTKYNNKYATHI